MEEAQGLAFGHQRCAYGAVRGGLLDVRAAQLRCRAVRHVDPTRSKGQTISRRECPPSRGRIAPRRDRLHGNATAIELVERTGITGKQRWNDTRDHVRHFRRRLGRREQLAELDQPGHFPVARLELRYMATECVVGRREAALRLLKLHVRLTHPVKRIPEQAAELPERVDDQDHGHRLPTDAQETKAGVREPGLAPGDLANDSQEKTHRPARHEQPQQYALVGRAERDRDGQHRQDREGGDAFGQRH